MVECQQHSFRGFVREESGLTRLLQLPQPTSHTERGPVVELDGGRLTVHYDCVTEDGVAEWTELVFEEVLTFGYRNMAACTDQDVLGADYVVEDDASTELDAAVNRWTTFVGWQGHEKGRQRADPFKHFRVFFDDAGAIDVIARSLEIVHPAHVK